MLPAAPVVRDPSAQVLLEQRGFDDIDMPDIRKLNLWSTHIANVSEGHSFLQE